MRTALIVIAVCWGDFALFAEEVRLANGASVQGEVLSGVDSPTCRIRLPGGALVAFPAEAVREVVPEPEARRQYRAMPPIEDTADEHVRVGLICRTQGLTAESRRHFERALEIDPKHDGAHRALGYVLKNDQWALPDAWERRQGKVWYAGRWSFPQDAAIAEQERRHDERERELRTQIRSWRSWLRRRKKQADGFANLRAIEDPIAAPILAKVLSDPKEPPEYKQLYIEVLARLGGRAAITALCKAGLVDPNAQVRSSAIDAAVGVESAEDHIAGLMISALKEKDPQIVNRAAGVLGRLKREDAIPALIEVLVVERVFEVGGGGRLSPTFGGGGAGGLNIEGAPKKVRKIQRHYGARDALAAITGTNQFDLNQAAWRQWYVRRNTPTSQWNCAAVAKDRYFLRCRILARMRRFFRPNLRRPFPVFFVPKFSTPGSLRSRSVPPIRSTTA